MFSNPRVSVALVGIPMVQDFPEEGIEFDGNLTPFDVHQVTRCYRLSFNIGGREISGAHILSVVVAPVLIVTAGAFATEGLWGGIRTLLLGGGLMLTLVLGVAVLAWRRLRRASLENAACFAKTHGRVHGVLQPTEIIFRHLGESTTLQWREFDAFYGHSDAIALRMANSLPLLYIHIISRSLFASESEWKIALGVVESNLPRVRYYDSLPSS